MLGNVEEYLLYMLVVFYLPVTHGERCISSGLVVASTCERFCECDCTAKKIFTYVCSDQIENNEKNCKVQ